MPEFHEDLRKVRGRGRIPLNKLQADTLSASPGEIFLISQRFRQLVVWRPYRGTYFWLQPFGASTLPFGASTLPNDGRQPELTKRSISRMTSISKVANNTSTSGRDNEKRCSTFAFGSYRGPGIEMSNRLSTAATFPAKAK
jgi:hypothetical protein